MRKFRQVSFLQKVQNYCFCLAAAVGPIDKTARWRQMRKKAGELWTDFYDAISETNEQLAEQQSDEVGRWTKKDGILDKQQKIDFVFKN